MTKKSKDLLVDAVVVIHAHEQKYWERLCNAHRIFIPGTILEDELFFFTSDKGKEPLLAATWVQQGKVTRVDAEHSDLHKLTQKLSDNFMRGIDPGEFEALALLLSKDHKNLHFTTADRMAIKALGLLGLRSRGVSVEELLSNLQALPTKSKKVDTQYTKKYFEKALTEGFSEQALWLKIPPKFS